MTHHSRRSIDRRLDQAERPADRDEHTTGDSGSDEPTEIVITDSLVADSDSEPVPFARTRCWFDETGTWRTERTELRARPDSEVA